MAKKKYFETVDLKVDFPQLEERILKYWKENNTFEKSVEKDAPNGSWTFLDGPPFITGLPHYGSLLSSIPKDLFPRYKTMRGYRVRRVWGWDCHGLPAENKVEVKLGITRKKDIEEKVGVKKFIDECKFYVKDVSSEWEWYVDHVGRWVDFKNAYKTMDLPYMESVMWVFKQMYEKGFIYKGLRVSLYCPHCSTPISNFEVAMDSDNYKELTEPANVYKYKIRDEEDTYFLAWSTTPWNKLATPALAINPKLKYVKVKQHDEYYILAKSTLKILNDEPYEEVEECKGSALVGKIFEPHYDFYTIDPGKSAFVVIGGEFVTADEGTGIVTIAAYGEEDLAVMQKNNIQIVLHVDDEGIVTKDSPIGGGMYYLKVNKLVNEDLKKRGLLYKEEQYTHTVPTCWRCHTRLFYAPQDAWYVDVQKLKPLMKQTNEGVNWVPKHFKDGRFLKSMEAAPDWCISRSRYWGSPVPVWECECGERIVAGSIRELEKLSGKKIKDLHKPEIDEVTIKCPKCGKNAKRVPEVLDSWIEAGSASFAERHFPFEKDIKLADFFPPDFIVEYTGQIRAWFYVLHVIAAALYKSNGFENVAVTGVILGTDGRKMSKNFGNYPDPKEMISKYGGDALRLYLMGSPVMHAEDVLISEEEYRNQVKGFLLPLWNVYNFFVTYASVDGWEPDKVVKVLDRNVLDRWIVTVFEKMVLDVTGAFDKFDSPAVVEILRKFIVNDLSGWYIRRSRDRRNGEFYSTCYWILVELTKVIAPISPFVTEEIYRNLTKEESVHLAEWPKVRTLTREDGNILQQMNFVREIVEWGHSIRKENDLKVRQPLGALWFFYDEFERNKKGWDYDDLIKSELNVKEIRYGDYDKVVTTKEKTKTAKDHWYLDIELTPELRAEGEARDIVRKIQGARKELGTSLDEKVLVSLPDWPEEFEDYIKKSALVASLTKGEFEVKRMGK